MKRQRTLSKALTMLALILLASLWLNRGVLAQEAKSRTGLAIADRPARLVVQLGHSFLISSVAFSPDGKYVLTGSADNSVLLWDSKSGKEVRRFEGNSFIGQVGFSPDGKYVLAAVIDGTVRMWEAETGIEVRRFQGYSAAISADGKYLLTHSVNTARVLEIATNKEVRRFIGHTDVVFSATFSPDGTYVLTGSFDKTARLWEADTGKEVHRFAKHTDRIGPAAFSADGKYVLTGSADKTICLWDAATGKEMQQFLGHSDMVSSVAFSPDGKYVLSGSWDHTVRLWESATGKELRQFKGQSDKILSVAFSPDAKYVLAGGIERMARLWESATGKEVRQFEGETSSADSIAISGNGKYILTGGDTTAQLWDMETGRQSKRLAGHKGSVKSVAFSPKDSYSQTYVLTAGSNKTALVWEAKTGEPVGGYIGHSDGIRSVVFSPDGTYVLTGSNDKTARLWEAGTGKELRCFVGHAGAIAAVAFSSDGEYVLTGSDDKSARLWDTETGKEIRRFTGHSGEVLSVAFSPDDYYVLTGSGDGTTRLWKAETGKEVRQFGSRARSEVGDPAIGDISYSVAFSPDGKYVLTGRVDSTVRLFETAIGKEVRRFEGHSGWLRSVVFSPDGKYVLSSSGDSTTRIWDISNGKELCQLISLLDGNWAVVAPDGRFEVSNLEEIKGLHWVMPDEPMRTYPLEIFMRDYYEPRLLPRILAGEQFKSVQSIASVNRVQPKVAIEAVTPQAGQPDLATVTVKVAKATGEFKQGDKKITRATGVYDLRLFRDGQLVAQLPSLNPTTNGAKLSPDATPEQPRNSWREQARVKLDANGEQTITFKNIHLPRRTDARQVEFSAYAFNEDRVKSITDRKSFEVPKDLKPVKGRAFVLAVGVNAHENSAWDLHFAANDARLAQQVLTNGLKQSGVFSDVVNVSLISDAQSAAGTKPATKANFKAALAEIARQARPEDLVLIYYSSHGYADRNGNYYFFTSDTGAGSEKAITPQLLHHLISSDELSAWLKDVDAGEMTLIIDACQSAGTVKGEAGGEFKPGPMGSRGLGQLAYDKGMRILAASQADDFAFEVAALQHGLLTYALMKDGIEARRADADRDGQITLTEALSYALDRVPKLFEALRSGELAKLFASEGSRAARVIGEASSVRKKNGFQKPSLFDFAKKRREIVLVTH